MECLRDGCQAELTGRQRAYCSDKCRKAQSRTDTTHEDGPGSTNADKPGHNYPLNADTCPTLNPDTPTRTNRIGPDVYYWPRPNTERLNWGEYMTAAELDQAGLKANRVTIPGDWDYVGVSERA